MHQDNVRSGQLLGPGDLSHNVLTGVNDKFQIKRRYQDTGVAVTGRSVDHVAQTPAKCEVRGLNGVEQHRSVDHRGRHVSEHGISLEFRHFEGRLDAGDDRLEEICEYVLRVLEFGSLQIGGVAGYVGKEQATLLG